MTHFTCHYCKTSLGGQRYIQRDQKSHCVPCYKKHYTFTQRSCHTCHVEIIFDQPHITQGEFHWHADANCFCCVLCQRNLLGKRYTFNKSHLICGSSEGCSVTNLSKQQHFLTNTANQLLKATTSDHQQQPDLIPATACVRFQLDQIKIEKRNRCAPPTRSPPPVPSSLDNSQCHQKTMLTKTPPENIYETVLTLSPSTSNSSPNHISNIFTPRHVTSRLNSIKTHLINDSTEEEEDEEIFSSANTKMTSVQKWQYDESKKNIAFSSRRNATKRSTNIPRSRSADGKHRRQACELLTPNKTSLKEVQHLKNSDIILRSYQNYYSRMPPDDTFIHYAKSGSCISGIGRNPKTYRLISLINNKKNLSFSCYSTSSSSESEADNSFLEHYLTAVSLPRQYNNATPQVKCLNYNKNTFFFEFNFFNKFKK